MNPFPKSEMPRERLLRHGASALGIRELLAIILRTGTKGHSVLALADDLLAAFEGNLETLSQASISELSQVSGIGQTKAIEICAAFALSRHLAYLKATRLPCFKSPDDIVPYMRTKLLGCKQEQFHSLLLDRHLNLMKDELVSIGLVDKSLVHSREVFRQAIRAAATSIILCHNHPSGNVIPSKQDIETTKALYEAGELLGIPIIDHIIVSSCPAVSSEKPYFSFLEAGLIRENAILVWRNRQ